VRIHRGIEKLERQGFTGTDAWAEDLPGGDIEGLSIKNPFT